MTSPIPPTGPDPDEQYVARLRAADPAADATPDATSLRAAVAARAAAVPDELAQRRSRRWLPVAAAAAAALVVGTGGGYAVGALQGDGSAVVAADSASVSEEMAGGGVAPGPMTAADPATGGGTESVARGGVSATDMYWGYGRTVFTAAGLSGDGGAAHAWALDAAAGLTEETVRALADALGLDAGSIRTEDGTWLVGPNDGTGATLSMYLGSGADVSYYDPAADAWACATVAEGGDDAAIAEPCAERDLGPAPSEQDATAQLLAVLAAVGIAEADVELQADGEASDGWLYLTAHRLVAGERSGLSWSASWTGGGLQSLYGTVAPLVDLGEYQVISPAEAVERLGDPRFGSSGGPIAYADDVVTLPAPEEGGQAQVPTTPEPGSAISWPVAEVSITSAELGLSTYSQADGAVVVAPTYQLTGDDGSIWSVIALVESALAF